MANTIKLGNGNWATKEGSLLAYNDENNNFKPLPFTTTRASSASVVNKQGLIETVGSAIPRIDFSDDANGALLLEPSRTNFDSQSTNFSTSFMSNSFGISSSVLTSEIAPDGSVNSVYKITKVTDHSDPYLGRSGLGFSNNNMVFSVWLWTDSNQPKDALFLVYRDATQEVQTKIITLTTTPTRYFIDANFSTTPSTVSYRIDLSGIESNQYIYAWGKQLEVGSYATSYIKTVGTAQTRVADTASGSGNSTVINSSEGVLYAEIAGLSNPVDSPKNITISDGTASNYVRIEYYQDGRVYGNVYDGASVASSFVVNQTNFNKIAIQYSSSGSKLYVNGTGVDFASKIFTSNTLNTIQFSSSTTNSKYFYGKVKDIRVYNEALTDSELQALTT